MVDEQAPASEADVTYADVHGLIMWPEAIVDAFGLLCLVIDVRLALVLLVIGAALHTTLIISLFTLPGTEDE